MKLHTIETYSLAELKELHPDSYARAFEQWRKIRNQDETPWQAETEQSIKELCLTCGVKLGFNRNGPFFTLPDEMEDFKGRRAFAWLENNLFSKLRKPFSLPSTRYKAEKIYKHKRPFTIAGFTRDCPLTGYYADHVFLDSIVKHVREGYSLGKAFSYQSYTWQEIADSDREQMLSEDEFLQSNEGIEFTKEGRVF